MALPKKKKPSAATVHHMYQTCQTQLVYVTKTLNGLHDACGEKEEQESNLNNRSFETNVTEIVDFIQNGGRRVSNVAGAHTSYNTRAPKASEEFEGGVHYNINYFKTFSRFVPILPLHLYWYIP